MNNNVKIVFFFILSFLVNAEDIVLGVHYLNDPYAHLHQNPITYSHSLTTLACGHPVKILDKKKIKSGWVYAQVGADKGYLRSSQLCQKDQIVLSLSTPSFSNILN